jgi:hypothetical protein
MQYLLGALSTIVLGAVGWIRPLPRPIKSPLSVVALCLSCWYACQPSRAPSAASQKTCQATLG